MRTMSLLVSAALLLTVGAAQIFAQSYPAQPQPAQQQPLQPQPAKDIVATVNDAGTFKTFVKAVASNGVVHVIDTVIQPKP